MNNIPVSTQLDLAADAIQMAGWGQGPATWLPEMGQGLCLEGAIMAVVGGRTTAGTVNYCPAGRAVRDYLGMGEYIVGHNALWDWNDAEGRTAEGVIEVLRAAAAVERAKEAVAGYENEDQPLPLDSEVAA